MNKGEALAALYEGKPVRCVEWDDEACICVEDGQIVDDKGESFDITSEACDKWEVYTPKEVEVEVITKDEAIALIFGGKKARALDWDNDLFIHVKEGQVVLNNDKAFDVMNAKEKEWVEFLAADGTDTLRKEIEELKNIVNELKGVKASQPRDHASRTQADNAELIKMVYGSSDKGDILSAFEMALSEAKSTRDIQTAVCQYIPYCWIGNRSLNTTKAYYNEMRQSIKECAGDHAELALSLFLPPQALYDNLQEKTAEKTKEKHADRDSYDLEFITQKIAGMRNDIENDNITKSRQQTEDRARAYLYAAYLALVTGRRQIEILKTLKIEERDGVWYYDGVMKDREEGKSIEAVSLDDDFEFLAGLVEYIHQEIDTQKMTNVAVNRKFNNIFNNAFKRLTDTGFTFKDAREIYADILYNKEGRDKGTWNEEEAYKAQVLGHAVSKDTLVTTEHYMTKEAK